MSPGLSVNMPVGLAMGDILQSWRHARWHTADLVQNLHNVQEFAGLTTP